MNQSETSTAAPASYQIPGKDGHGLHHTLSRLRSYLLLAPLCFLYTGVLGVASLTISLFDHDGRRQHRIARAWARLILKTTARHVTVLGAEHIDWTLPQLYAANHLSAMDIPLLYAKLPTQFRIVAKKELFSIPILGWHLRRSGQIPVASSNIRASFRSLNAAVQSLHHGHPIVIFPEGGRSPSGALLPFMSGPFYIAIKAQVSIIPMAIIGTYEMLPMNTFHIMPRDLKLVFGAPISPAGYTLRDLDALGSKVESAIRALYDANR